MNNEHLEIFTNELTWIRQLLSHRLMNTNNERVKEQYFRFDDNESCLNREVWATRHTNYAPPELNSKKSEFHKFIKENKLNIQERILLDLLLLFKTETKRMSFVTKDDGLSKYSDLIQTTFTKDHYTEYKLPTLSTWLHLLNNRDTLESLKVLYSIEQEDYFLFKNGIVTMTEPEHNLPISSSIISIREDVIKSIINNTEIENV